jgi:hypothetical protein
VAATSMPRWMHAVLMDFPVDIVFTDHLAITSSTICNDEPNAHRSTSNKGAQRPVQSGCQATRRIDAGSMA